MFKALKKYMSLIRQSAIVQDAKPAGPAPSVPYAEDVWPALIAMDSTFLSKKIPTALYKTHNER
mgnify:CR=1 FL=1